MGLLRKTTSNPACTPWLVTQLQTTRTAMDMSYARVDRYVLSLEVLSRMPLFDQMTDADVKLKLMYVINSRSTAFVDIKKLRIER